MRILALQGGKRSSENGFQTTFGLAGKGSSLEDRVRAYRTHPTYGFCGIAGRVCAQRHARGCRLRLAHAVVCYSKLVFIVNQT